MVVISFISAIGLGLGKVRLMGISLGVTFVFFVGILAGHLGFTVDPAMRTYAESFGLVIFVYALCLQGIPRYFRTLRAFPCLTWSAYSAVPRRIHLRSVLHSRRSCNSDSTDRRRPSVAP